MRGRERRQPPAQLADRRARAAQDHGSRHTAESINVRRACDVTATTDAPPATDADTIVVGVFEDEGIAHDHGGVLQALVDSGEAKRGLRKLAVTHAEGRRYIVAGLGGRSDFDPERARVAAAAVVGRAKELGTKTLCWEVPHHVTDAHVGALVEGTLLAAYAYREFKARRRRRRARRADPLRPPRRRRGRRRTPRRWPPRSTARATCRTAPANVLTPTALAERAQALEGVTRRGARPAPASRPRAWARSRRSRSGSLRGPAADHDPLRAGRTSPARCSGSSARP